MSGAMPNRPRAPIAGTGLGTGVGPGSPAHVSTPTIAGIHAELVSEIFTVTSDCAPGGSQLPWTKPTCTMSHSPGHPYMSKMSERSIVTS